jgi:CRP/FNR family cyclic AMP-dependent transcriptional regulator
VRFEPSSLLDRLDQRERDALLHAGRSRAFLRDEALFLEAESTDHVMVLTHGRVKACFADRNGREAVLAVRGAGDLLGDLSAIDGGPRSAAVFALEAVEATVIAGARFRALLVERPRLASAVLALMVARLRDADRKRIEFGSLDSRARVACRLVELAHRFGEPARSGVRITLRLSQEEVAGWTGSSREAVAKALADFRTRGWIETGRRRVVVLDLDALARAAR